MNLEFIVPIALLLIAAFAFGLKKPRHLLGEYFANAILAVNIYAEGRKTYLADNAFTTRYLLAKPGSDVNHIDICTAADIPLGVVPDMTPSSGDLTMPLPVNLFPVNNQTERVVASAAITVGQLLTPAAAGKVQFLPVAAGTYYVIGRALTAAAANNDLLEIAPMFFKEVH